MISLIKHQNQGGDKPSKNKSSHAIGVENE